MRIFSSKSWPLSGAEEQEHNLGTANLERIEETGAQIHIFEVYSVGVCVGGGGTECHYYSEPKPLGQKRLPPALTDCKGPTLYFAWDIVLEYKV